MRIGRVKVRVISEDEEREKNGREGRGTGVRNDRARRGTGG